MAYNGDLYFYVKNLQGDVIGITDKNGAVVVEYSYDSWGNILTTTGSMASTIGAQNPFRYRGYYYDTETGMYYLGSRYYDPEIRRFISPDAWNTLLLRPMTLCDKNLYVYCDHNPVVRKDSNGCFWLGVLSTVVGAAVNVASTL